MQNNFYTERKIFQKVIQYLRMKSSSNILIQENRGYRKFLYRENNASEYK